MERMPALIILLCLATLQSLAVGQLNTKSGYDNPTGNDPLCWITPRTNTDEMGLLGGVDGFDVATSENSLIKDFPSAAASLLSKCPPGTSVDMNLTRNEDNDSSPLQVGRSYTFHINTTLDLTAIRDKLGLSAPAFFTSDDGIPAVAFRIQLYKENGNQCSPFSSPRSTSDDSTPDVFGLRRPGKESISSPFEIVRDIGRNETFFEFHTDIDVFVPTTGNYVPLATVQFFLADGSSTGSDTAAVIKFDMANVLRDRVIHIRPQLRIPSVRLLAKILANVLIGASLLCQLYLLYSVVQYRNESVLKLSQVWFLVTLQASGIVATVSCVFYDHRTTFHCYVQSPLTMIPLQLMLAITYGRLHRIVVIMKPLLDWGKSTGDKDVGLAAWKKTLIRSGQKEAPKSVSKSVSQYIAQLFRRPPRQTKQRKLRQEFTATQLSNMVLKLAIPVILSEGIGLALFDRDLRLNIDLETMTGRYQCGLESEWWFFALSPFFATITMVLALREALRSSKLPAFFNEAERVSVALISSLFVCFMGFAVVLVSRDPTSYPDASFLVKVFMVCFTSTALQLRLVLPKLKLVWKGEQVVMSQELRKHKESQAGGASSYSFGVSSCASSKLDLSIGNPRTSSLDSTASNERSSADFKPSSRPHFNSSSSQREMKAEMKPRKDDLEMGISTQDSKTKAEREEYLKGRTRPNGTKQISSQLMSGIYGHSVVVARVAERLMSGLLIQTEDWDKFQGSMDEIEALLDRKRVRTVPAEEVEDIRTRMEARKRRSSMGMQGSSSSMSSLPGTPPTDTACLHASSLHCEDTDQPIAAIQTHSSDRGSDGFRNDILRNSDRLIRDLLTAELSSDSEGASSSSCGSDVEDSSSSSEEAEGEEEAEKVEEEEEDLPSLSEDQDDASFEDNLASSLQARFGKGLATMAARGDDNDSN